MFLVIDASISIGLADKAKNKKIAKALELLAQSVREGHHLVYAGVDVLLPLSMNTLFTEDARATFSALVNRNVTFKKIKANIVDHIVCYFDDNNNGITRKGDAIWIPIEWFDSSKKIQPTMLIAENDSDCELYNKLGRFFSNTKGLPSDITFVDMPGGGDTIGKIYKKRQSTVDTPILCLADNDKSCPGMGNGSTAKKVISNDDPNNMLSSYSILPVRMLENLLPLKFYIDTYGGCADKIRGVEFLKEVTQDLSVSEVRRYIHFKNGICYKKINETKKPAKKVYWKSIEGDLRRISVVPIKEVVMASFGSKILEDALVYFEDDSNLLELQLDEFTKDDTYEISEKIYSWGCSTNSLRNF